MKLINKKNGFSLTEMVVTIVLVGIIGMIVASLYSGGNKQYRLGTKRLQLNEQAALAVRDFEKISRGTTAIISATNNDLTFYTYLKGDTHPAPSKINYYLDNNQLYRSSIAPIVSENTFVYPESQKEIKLIAQNVITMALFQYYNDANTELTFPIQNDVVRLIKMSIEIDDDINVSPESAEQSTAVQLRNLKNNL